MKTIIQYTLFTLFLTLISCQGGNAPTADANAANATNTAPDMGQAGVADDVSQKDIVKVALGSADHTTLVKALQQAEYVNDLANAGPFTVFAPTNAAFEKLPAGTVEGLMKDDQKAALQNILEYHVAVGVYRENMFRDGQTINMANAQNVTVQMKDGKIMLNNSANVVATVPASNGIIYVIDAVLLPPQ